MKNLTNIGNFSGLEFATFKLKEGVSEETMLQMIKEVDSQFLQKEDGFLGHTTLKGKDGIYADVAFATTEQKAKEICEKWMQNDIALKYIELVDETSVNMTFWNRIK